MSSNDFQIIILAAGKGTRMKSATPKVLHHLNGIPMLIHVLNTVQELQPRIINIVVGYEKEKVIETVEEWRRQSSHEDIQIQFILQEEQLGTGHAVICAGEKIDNKEDHIMILLGDVPLIKTETLKTSMRNLSSHDTDAVVLTTELEEPYGYGRIIRDEQDDLKCIREEKDASQLERSVKEINTGIFLFQGKFLWKYIHQLKSDNQKSEFYLTDMVSILRENTHSITALKIEHPEQFLGVNSPEQLRDAEIKGASVCIH